LLLIPVKYRVALDDGTVVAETPEEGFEFYVKDGNFFLEPLRV
jgi:FK506-binding protein 4/5